MADIEKVAQAFRILEQFEAYRIRRAWGIMVIVIGVSNFVAAILLHILFYKPLEDPFAFMRTISIFRLYNYILFLCAFGPIVLSFLLAFFTYFSVRKTRIDENKLSFHRYAFLGFALFFMSFFPSFLIMMPFSQLPVNYLWSGVFGSLLSYFFLRKLLELANFREVLYLGLVLALIAIIFSILYFIEALVIMNWVIFSIYFQGLYVPFNFGFISCLFAFLVCYVITGYYSIKKSTLILERGSGFQY